MVGPLEYVPVLYVLSDDKDLTSPLAGSDVLELDGVLVPISFEHLKHHDLFEGGIAFISVATFDSKLFTLGTVLFRRVGDSTRYVHNSVGTSAYREMQVVLGGYFFR